DPVLLDTARLGHRQQQEIELLEALGELWQEAARLPACQRCGLGLAVDALVIVTEDRLGQVGVQLRERELGSRRWGAHWPVAWQRTHIELVDRPEEALDSAPP